MFSVINGGSQMKIMVQIMHTFGTHATQCMGICYGRGQGWAYNANKWHINNIGSSAINIEGSADLIKVFHNCKPNNPSLGTGSINK